MKSLRVLIVESGPSPNPHESVNAAEESELDVHLRLKVLTSTPVDARLQGSTTLAVENILQQHKEICERKGLVPTVISGAGLMISLGGGISDAPWSTDPSVRDKPLNAIISGGPKVLNNQSPVFLSRLADEDEVELLLKRRGAVSDQLPFFQFKGPRKRASFTNEEGTRNDNSEEGSRWTRFHYFREIYSANKDPNKPTIKEAWEESKARRAVDSGEEDAFETGYRTRKAEKDKAALHKASKGPFRRHTDGSGSTKQRTGGGNEDEDEDEDEDEEDEDEDEEEEEEDEDEDEDEEEDEDKKEEDEVEEEDDDEEEEEEGKGDHYEPGDDDFDLRRGKTPSGRSVPFKPKCEAITTEQINSRVAAIIANVPRFKDITSRKVRGLLEVHFGLAAGELGSTQQRKMIRHAVRTAVRERQETDKRATQEQAASSNTSQKPSRGQTLAAAAAAPAAATTKAAAPAAETTLMSLIDRTISGQSGHVTKALHAINRELRLAAAEDLVPVDKGWRWSELMWTTRALREGESFVGQPVACYYGSAWRVGWVTGSLAPQPSASPRPSARLAAHAKMSYTVSLHCHGSDGRWIMVKTERTLMASERLLPKAAEDDEASWVLLEAHGLKPPPSLTFAIGLEPVRSFNLREDPPELRSYRTMPRTLAYFGDGLRWRRGRVEKVLVEADNGNDDAATSTADVEQGDTVQLRTVGENFEGEAKRSIVLKQSLYARWYDVPKPVGCEDIGNWFYLELPGYDGEEVDWSKGAGARDNANVDANLAPPARVKTRPSPAKVNRLSMSSHLPDGKWPGAAASSSSLLPPRWGAAQEERLEKRKRGS